MCKKILGLLFLTLVFSCNEQVKKKVSNESVEEITMSPTDTYIQEIEKVHQKASFLDKKAISFDFLLTWGGTQAMDAKITLLTNSSKIRIDKNDDTKLIYDGQKAYLCPEDADDKGARFTMFTWSYFFGLPYKLDDPGANLKLGSDMNLNNLPFATSKLTFDKGIGDPPDDWYLLFTNKENNRLHAAAYIVTYGGKDINKANEDPHVIIYRNHETFEGIPIATHWEFYAWNATEGLKERIGEATLSNVNFLDAGSELFQRPENAREILK